MNTKHYSPISKYRMLLPLLLLFLNACILQTIRGSGNIVTEARDVRDFNRVVFGGTGELLLTQSGEESLTVSADDNVMGYIEAEVRGKTLYIGLTDKPGPGVSPSQPIRFNLNVKEIASLDVAGIARTETGEIVTEQLAVKVSGSSSLSMTSLEAQKLTLNLSGSNEVEVTGIGEVTEQKVVLIGASSYYALGLRSQSADVTMSGSSEAAVWATDFLDVSVAGKGSLDYYGNPQISQRVSGKARINSLGIP